MSALPAHISRGADLSVPPGPIIRAYRRERWLAMIIAFVIVSALILTGVLEPIDYRLADYRARILDRPPSGQIQIVEIDAKSIAAIKSWPWSRAYHARLIRRLHDAGASIIAFDVDFSSNADAKGDEALARALRDVEPVILPVFEQRASTDANDLATIRNRPMPSLAASWVGGVNILPEIDGVVRQFPAATMIGGRIQPSMATLLSDNDEMGDREFIPDWSINAKQIRRLSFIDVLNGKVPASAVRGKRLIVGATAIELGDRYTIPRFGAVPGVVVQALAADSLLQHRALSRLGPIPDLGVAAFIILALGAVIRSAGARSFMLAAAGLFAVLAGPVAAQAYWPISIDAAGPLAACLVGVTGAFAVEVRKVRKMQLLRDPATGLPNVEALVAKLSELDRSKGLVLTGIGIDRPEAIRSVIGNTGMDRLVKEACARLERALQTPVYLIAPETLAWLSAETEKEYAEKAESQFCNAFEISGQSVDVRCTMGVASVLSDDNAHALAERSLIAIHLARSSGTNRQTFQSIAPEVIRNLSIMGDLRRGIENGEVFIAYQPKLNLRTARIDQAEALVRWRHPIDGMIPPDRFIPLAEETGEIRHLTRFVLSQAMRDWCQLSATNPAIGLSINASTADIAEPQFADEVFRMLSETGVDPGRLTIEITESAIFKSQDAALKVLSELKGHGIRLSIDDYGTGQSTLSYVKKLPVNELKIDKMFVTSITANEADQIMVRSTIDLAHELGLQVVAEGVEDWETVAALDALGCDYAQGYVIGKAMPIEELLRENLHPISARKAA